MSSHQDGEVRQQLIVGAFGLPAYGLNMRFFGGAVLKMDLALTGVRVQHSLDIRLASILTRTKIAARSPQAPIIKHQTKTLNSTP